MFCRLPSVSASRTAHVAAIFRAASSKATPSARAALGEKTYSVAKVQADGSLSLESLKLPDILRNSSLHARDLFSLALTSSHDVEEDNRLHRRRRCPRPRPLPTSRERSRRFSARRRMRTNAENAATSGTQRFYVTFLCKNIWHS